MNAEKKVVLSVATVLAAGKLSLTWAQIKAAASR